jgi:hypothetical protein
VPHTDVQGRVVPYAKSSNAVTLSALVQTPTAPGATICRSSSSIDIALAVQRRGNVRARELDLQAVPSALLFALGIWIAAAALATRH